MFEEVIEATGPSQHPDIAQPGQTPASPSAAQIASVVAAAALAACGGGGSGSRPAPAPVAGRTVTLPTAGYSYLTPTSNEQAARFLMQAQFSASDADIASVRSLGFVPWLQGQIAVSYTTGWDWLGYQGYDDPINTANYYDSSAQADYMIWSQLMAGTAPVRARMALALSELFVVSLSGISATWPSHIIAYYWDTLCKHSLGNYRDLLEAITLNVAMGYYLNTKGNLKENSSGRQPDENYSREVMQLFSVGLKMLNPDGTEQLDGSGNKIDTYGLADVSSLAHVFTGYDLDMSQNRDTVIQQTGGGTRTIPNVIFASLPMKLTQSNHSTAAVTFLGVTIPANTPAPDALKIALDTLFNHPNNAPFICKQLIQRLVTSNPSPAYVARVAAVFANNGSGVRGDLAYVLSAILMDDEARGPAGLTDVEYGKLREPMVRLVQWARTFGVTSTSGSWKIGDQSDAGSRLGQSPLRAPSVFNFFRPGYVPPSTALTAGKVAPEFQLVNESSVGGYLNFMMGVVDTGFNSGDIKAAYTSELALVTDATALVQRLNLLLCAGQLSAATQSLIVTALQATPVTATSSATTQRNRVCAAVLMVMASAEYLIQK
jgi:uncharacterized protein (DUF1800 family)